jgi:hypothetical protein
MAGYAKGEAGSKLVASFVYDIHNMFKLLHPCHFFIAMLIRSNCCSLPSYVTSPKYQKAVVTRVGRRMIERPSQDMRRASPRRHLVRLDTLKSTKAFLDQRCTYMTVWVFEKS